MWLFSRYSARQLLPTAITGQQTMKTVAAFASEKRDSSFSNWWAIFLMMSGYFKLFIHKCPNQVKKKKESYVTFIDKKQKCVFIC
jgi:hypothetical protein